MIDVEKQKNVIDYKLWAKLATYSKVEDVMRSYNFCVWVTLAIAVELVPGLWNTHRSHDQAYVVTPSFIKQHPLCIFNFILCLNTDIWRSGKLCKGLSITNTILGLNFLSANPTKWLNKQATMNGVKSSCSCSYYCVVIHGKRFLLKNCSWCLID